MQPGTFSGEIVVCDFPFVSTIDEILEAAGAGGFVLVVPSFLNSLTTSDLQYTFPGLFLSGSDGEALETWLASGSGHQATIRGISTEAGRGDVMDSRSSRGPNGEAPDVLKPDLVAPGVTIVGAYPGEEGGLPAYHLESGSSMATPHVAGAAALIRAAHPDWSPAEIQSAFMLTSNDSNVVAEDETTPATPFDRGAGRIDVSRAVGAALVLDEDQTDYEAVNPAIGGDPTTLNLASLTDGDCDGTCSWSRELRSTWNISLTWVAETSSDSALALTVEPDTWMLEPGATRTISVTANTAGLTGGEWVFGTLTLTPQAGSQVYTGTPPLHLPVAVRPSPGLVIHKTGPDTAMLGETIIYTLTVENTNPDAPVNDLLITDELPQGTTYLDGSGGTYSLSSNAVSWTLASLAAGSSQSVAFAVMATTAAPTITNDTYDVTVGEVYPVMGEAVTTVISGDIDVDLSKTGPEAVTFGEPVTYTLTVRNRRTDAPVYHLTITDELPAGTTYLDDSGGTYRDSDHTVSWTLDRLEAGGSENLVFAVTPSVTGTVVNDTYSAMIGEVSLASGAPITTEVLMETSLSIHKSGPAEAMTGEAIVYTLTVSNTGTSEVANITVSDELPAGTTYVEGSGGTYHQAENTVSWTLDSLEAGSHENVTFAVVAAAEGTITNDTYQVAAEGFYPAAGEQPVTTSVFAPFDLEALLVNKDPSVLSIGTSTQDIPVGTAQTAQFGFMLTNPQENDQSATFMVLGSGNTWPTTYVISSTTSAAVGLAASAGEDLTVPLAVGESAQVRVEMELPENAQPGDSDTLQMSVRLQDGTPGQQAEFPLTVNLTQGAATGHRVYLPLVRK
ncbi:MAG: DUF11 domain-containing protein [Chloroflexaceae bacterium]|nr:DUF11 domain-containing protein [Chloroflexaceae bacterium]